MPACLIAATRGGNPNANSSTFMPKSRAVM